MIIIKSLFFVIFLPFLSILSVYAGQWEQAVREVPAEPKEPFVEVAFSYKQTAAELKKTPKLGLLPEGVKLLPDSASEARVPVADASKNENTHSFRFGIPVGCLSGERTIILPLVDTADPEPRELKVILKVPELVEITPRRLIWKKGAVGETKITSVVSLTREGVALTKVEVEETAFEAVLERHAAQLYTVKITPKDVSKARHTVIRVFGTDIYGRETSFNLYAEIK